MPPITESAPVADRDTLAYVSQFKPDVTRGGNSESANLGHYLISLLKSQLLVTRDLLVVNARNNELAETTWKKRLT